MKKKTTTKNICQKNLFYLNELCVCGVRGGGGGGGERGVYGGGARGVCMGGGVKEQIDLINNMFQITIIL